jgi:hypothetical protein
VRALDNYISLGSASRVQFLREKLLLRALLSDFSVGFGAKITRSLAGVGGCGVWKFIPQPHYDAGIAPNQCTAPLPVPQSSCALAFGALPLDVLIKRDSARSTLCELISEETFNLINTQN